MRNMIFLTSFVPTFSGTSATSAMRRQFAWGCAVDCSRQNDTGFYPPGKPWSRASRGQQADVALEDGQKDGLAGHGVVRRATSSCSRSSRLSSARR